MIFLKLSINVEKRKENHNLDIWYKTPSHMYPQYTHEWNRVEREILSSIEQKTATDWSCKEIYDHLWLYCCLNLIKSLKNSYRAIFK